MTDTVVGYYVCIIHHVWHESHCCCQDKSAQLYVPLGAPVGS